MVVMQNLCYREDTVMAEASRVTTEAEHTSELVECTWPDIEQPGAYVDLETGYLYRIPTAALQQRAVLLI